MDNLPRNRAQDLADARLHAILPDHRNLPLEGHCRMMDLLEAVRSSEVTASDKGEMVLPQDTCRMRTMGQRQRREGRIQGNSSLVWTPRVSSFLILLSAA